MSQHSFALQDCWDIYIPGKLGATTLLGSIRPSTLYTWGPWEILGTVGHIPAGLKGLSLWNTEKNVKTEIQGLGRRSSLGVWGDAQPPHLSKIYLVPYINFIVSCSVRKRFECTRHFVWVCNLIMCEHYLRSENRKCLRMDWI